MTSFLFLNPPKILSVFQENIIFTNSPSVKGLHSLTIRLLTLNDGMIALLEIYLGFANNSSSADNFKLSFWSLSLHISLLRGKSESYLLLWRAL
jgi:hypothetical protein